ncbi:MAG: hypothetical protein QW300_05800, partial [Desulfurococcaceae archaeon]
EKGCVSVDRYAKTVNVKSTVGLSQLKTLLKPVEKRDQEYWYMLMNIIVTVAPIKMSSLYCILRTVIIAKAPTTFTRE